MAKGADDDFGVLLAGGIMLGLGWLAASKAKEAAEVKRQQFHEDLRREIERLGIGLRLESLTLGRGKHNEPFWVVLIQRGDGSLWKRRVALEVGADPYGTAVPAALAERVASELKAS